MYLIDTVFESIKLASEEQLIAINRHRHELNKSTFFSRMISLKCINEFSSLLGIVSFLSDYHTTNQTIHLAMFYIELR